MESDILRQHSLALSPWPSSLKTLQILSKIEQNLGHYSTASCRAMLAAGESKAWYNSQYPQQQSQSTPFKDSSTQHHLARHKRNLHPLATSKDTKKDSALHWCTKQQTSGHITNADWKGKTHINSLVATFLLNSKSNWKYVSVKLKSHSVRLQIDTASDITFIPQRL